MDQWIVDGGWLNFPYEVAVLSDIKKLSIGSRTSGRNEVRVRVEQRRSTGSGFPRGLQRTVEHRWEEKEVREPRELVSR